MLVPEAKFTVSSLPDIIIFPDDESASSFYAVSAKPRLVVDDSGAPQISLMLYGKRTSGQFEPTGGFLSLTVSVGLRLGEEKALLTQLAQSAPAPRLLGLPWLSGEVTLTLGHDVEAKAQPSMVGDNRCSFSIKLNGDQANAIAMAWQDSLRAMNMQYRVSVRGGPASQSRTAYTESYGATRVDDQLKTQIHLSGETTSLRSSPLNMELVGGVDLSDSDLASRLSQVEL